MSQFRQYQSGTPSEDRKILAGLHNGTHFLIEKGHFDEAIACFNTLADGDETYECGDYAYGLGLAYEGKGDLAEALRYFEIAVENNPPDRKFKVARDRIKERLGETG